MLSQQEVQRLFEAMDGTPRLMARLMYGTGMRLHECATLRVRDVSFDRGLIAIRGAKGAKDRFTMLPTTLRAELKAHVGRVRKLFDEDRAQNAAPVAVPDAVKHKTPQAGLEWGWFLFPMICRSCAGSLIEWQLCT